MIAVKFHLVVSRYVTTAEAAQLAGIAPATLRSYSSRGLAPKPVRLGIYSRAAVEKWLRDRPGQGKRTDIR